MQTLIINFSDKELSINEVELAVEIFGLASVREIDVTKILYTSFLNARNKIRDGKIYLLSEDILAFFNNEINGTINKIDTIIDELKYIKQVLNNQTCYNSTIGPYTLYTRGDIFICTNKEIWPISEFLFSKDYAEFKSKLHNNVYISVNQLFEAK